MLTLYHPRLDIRIQEVITMYKTEFVLRTQWKYRYGKILEQCIIKVVDDEYVEPMLIQMREMEIDEVPKDRANKKIGSRGVPVGRFNGKVSSAYCKSNY